MWDLILDAFVDTIKIMPILYLVYLLVSYVSHNNNEKFGKFMKKTQKAGPFMGAVLGVVPQCGFSGVMADLYSKKSITLGTLIAVFVATSDEAIPIMLAMPESYLSLLSLILIKFASAIIFGFVIDIIISLIERNKLQVLEMKNKTVSKEKHNHCECEHCCADNIFWGAFVHTIKISIFLFIASFIINLIIFWVGLDALTATLNTNKFLQPIVASLIGLIPSCASSVLLVELFLQNTITFASVVAGLSVGSGIGLLVLFKQNKNFKHNILITLLVFSLGAFLGILISLF